MSVWQQQQVDELRQRIGVCMQRRAELEGVRVSPTAAAPAADQIRRLDSDLQVLCRDLAAAERKLKDGP